MKIRTILWLTAIVLCVVLGIRQKQNLSFFLREYNALWRDYDYRDYSIVSHKPLIPENIARDDPEAAIIAEYISGHHEENERLLSIAEGLVKYPQNEFLLGEFLGFISDNIAYDPELRLRTTKHLISLNPRKPFYYYFTADALLACGSDINVVLDAIELGNRCSDYNIPYDKYRQRVIDIAEKSKLSRMQIRYLDYERLASNPYGLDRELIGLAAAAFADGNNLIGTRICDAVYEMQRKYIVAGDLRAMSMNNLKMMSSFVNFGNWDVPEGLELQRVELSKESARKDRLRLCSRVPFFVFEESEKPYVRSQADICDERKAEWALLAIMLAPYFGRMFLSFGLAVFILSLFFFAASNMKKEKAGFFKLIMFAFACLVFFLVAKGVYIRLVEDNCGSSYTLALRPFKFTLDTLKSEPVLTVIFLVAPIVGLFFWQISRKSRWWSRAMYLAAVTACCIGIDIWGHRRELHDLFLEDLIEPIIFIGIVILAGAILIILGRWLSKWRIVWLATAASFFGGLSIASSGYFYLEFVVMLLFIFFSAATVVGPAPKEKSPITSLFTLFGSGAPCAAIRVKCLKLVAPFIVVYWLIFVCLMPASAYRINCEANRESPPRRKYTAMEPNEATYHRVLNYLENTSQTQYGVSRILGLVMPEDLPDVLEKIKALPSDEYYGARRFNPSWRGYDPNMPMKPNVTPDPNRAKDALLTRAITSSGRDAVTVLTAYISNPDNPRTLLARAKLGDTSAKQPLERLLAQHIADGNDFPRGPDNTGWMDRPLSSAEIIPALACVSEPNEVAQRYLSFIQRNNMPEVIDERDFVRGINLLPTQQAKVVLKAYLAKAADWQPPYTERWPSLRDALNSLRGVVGCYADREIAESVFLLMLRVYENNGEFRGLNISPYFTIESARLLKKGLNVPNDEFRAWCVWQLRKVGYKFTADEFDKLLKDQSWVVRANTIMTEQETAKNAATNDKNSFIRFIATLSE